MASGAMIPAPAPIPVQPIVRTRKKAAAIERNVDEKSDPESSGNYQWYPWCQGRSPRNQRRNNASREKQDDRRNANAVDLCGSVLTLRLHVP